MELTKIEAIQGIDPQQEKQIISFLHQHLGEFRDSEEEIAKCLQYAQNPDRGGQIYLASKDETIAGCVVVLNTGMDGFVPPYLLVYIAVDESQRGQGIGKKLVTMVKEDLGSAIALHVEHHNPAKRLYEREGFTNKYTEMRWQP